MNDPVLNKLFEKLGSGVSDLATKQSEIATRKFKLNHLVIQTKERRLLHLSEEVLNPAQKKIYAYFKDDLEAGIPLIKQRHIVLKPRQIGSSTLFTAMFFLDTINNPNTNFVIMAHEKNTAQNLLSLCKRFHANLGTLAPQKGIDNTEELSFPVINSKITVSTSRNAGSGRGFMFHNFLGTETAYWDNAREIISGVFESVPVNGNVVLESTANGEGDFFHQHYLKSMEGETQYVPHFYPWILIKEYQDIHNPVEISDVRGEHDTKFGNEQLLMEVHGVTLAQLSFRRRKILDKPIDPLKIFKQEYPITAAEAFIGSGETMFDATALANMKTLSVKPKHSLRHVPISLRETRINLTDAEIELYQLPKWGTKYLLVCDPAEGLDREGNHDFTSIMVLDLESWAVVCRVSSRRINPLMSSKLCLELGSWYNTATLMVERNNHGHAVIQGITSGRLNLGGIVSVEENQTLAFQFDSDLGAFSGNGSGGGYPLNALYYHTDFTSSTTKRKTRAAKVGQMIQDIGFPASVKTKKLSEDCLAILIKDEALGVSSFSSLAQLSDYRKLPLGNTGASKGNHDDDVSCLRMIAYFLNYSQVIETRDDKLNRGKNRSMVLGRTLGKNKVVGGTTWQ